jgi:hypothetical protein
VARVLAIGTTIARGIGVALATAPEHGASEVPMKTINGAVTLLILALGCAPPRVTPVIGPSPSEEPRAKREEADHAVANFYNALPILRGREKCVARALNTLLPDKTWENLAQAAISFCVPPPPPFESSGAWVEVATDANGHKTFIDVSRIEFRESDQVTFWALIELYDDSTDFLLARQVVDCDRKLVAPLEVANVTTGKYVGPSVHISIDWASALPNTSGETMLKAVCAARATVTNPPDPRHAPSARQGI